MMPVIGVACTGQIGQELKAAISSMNLNAKFVFSDTLIHNEAVLPQELERADVILTSGYLIKVIRKLTDKPVVQMAPSLLDVLSCYNRIKELYHDAEPVIILPEESKLFGIDILQKVSGIQMNTRYYEDLHQIDFILADCKAHNYDVVIGSGLVCERSEKMGFATQFIYPQEALRRYVNAAFEAAYSLNRSQEMSRQLATIIKNSRQGILFTDSDGTITVANSLSLRMTNSEKEGLIEKNIKELLPEKETSQLFNERIPVNHLICSFNEKQFIISMDPIIAKGKLKNIMVTIDDIHHIQSQEQHIRKALANKGYVARHHFTSLSTENPRYAQLITKAKKYALSDENILITGETGTGKEVLCQSIHNFSERASKPFVAVNCSAINENLLESELFGYEEGAFTGARKGGKEGYFEQADGGTIFLDEIGEMSYSLQSKLLRAIQEKEIIRVGGNHVIRFDARLIVATNKNLWELAQSGTFREDLYYRLSVLELEIPPLRERTEDIVPLFLKFSAERNPVLTEGLKRHEKELREILCTYFWPGNVRELENYVKALMVSWEDAIYDDEILDMMKNEISFRKNRESKIPFQSEPSISICNNKGQIIADTTQENDESARFLNALKACNGNMSKAAKMLGISRTTLWRKSKSLIS